MKINNKVAHKYNVIVIVAIALAIAPIVFIVSLYWPDGAYKRLLCETDHQVLLTICRQIMKQGNLKAGSRYFDMPQFPQIIRKLDPTVVWISDYNFLCIGIRAGMSHIGVYAYPEDFKAPYEKFKYGDKELIPGLWYFDEDYYLNPDYDKRIEKLLQKRK